MISAAWNGSPNARWPWRRLLTALMVSAVAHYLIVDGWRPSGGPSQFPAVIPQLQARLEMPEVLPAAPEKTIAEDSPAELPEKRAALSRTARVAPARAPAVAAPEMNSPENPGAAVPDLRVYSARELDRYPVPLMPLDLRTGQGRSGIARFWVNIDSMGYAVGVELIAGDLPAVLTASARELLLAARFAPGFKDERPVKSRILLELRYGP
jgi:hypothetical protein